MAPLADAVGLVHGNKRALDLTQEGAKAGEGQPLGRGINQLVLALGHPGHAAAQLVAIEG